MAAKTVRITHVPSGQLIAEGPVGWGITPFEGSWYIAKKHLKTDGFRANGIPGVCFYKFLYLWLDFSVEGRRTRFLAWRYILPNPLFPFIAFRVAVSGTHPEIDVVVDHDAKRG